MWQTVVVGSIVGLVFVWIVATQIRNRLRGKGGCSCGGNCGACGMNCHSRENLDASE